MITDKDYRNISEDVYKVDSLKDSPTPPIEGGVVADKKFVILSQPQDMINGMQAMAVAPIKGYDAENKPIPDTSQVVIASFSYPDFSVNTDYL